jgi:hypothetical protein
VRFWIGRGLQVAGMVGVGIVLILNLAPQGITMMTMLQFTAFSVLLFVGGTLLLRGTGRGGASGD